MQKRFLAHSFKKNSRVTRATEMSFVGSDLRGPEIALYALVACYGCSCVLFFEIHTYSGIMLVSLLHELRLVSIKTRNNPHHL